MPRTNRAIIFVIVIICLSATLLLTTRGMFVRDSTCPSDMLSCWIGAFFLNLVLLPSTICLASIGGIAVVALLLVTLFRSFRKRYGTRASIAIATATAVVLVPSAVFLVYATASYARGDAFIPVKFTVIADGQGTAEVWAYHTDPTGPEYVTLPWSETTITFKRLNYRINAPQDSNLKCFMETRGGRFEDKVDQPDSADAIRVRSGGLISYLSCAFQP